MWTASVFIDVLHDYVNHDISETVSEVTMKIPEHRCDLVMKGGVTSGVVYPLVVAKLAEDYRFERIGGTSAGAISAVITAAAEYGRQTGGFKKIAQLPKELSTGLLSKFQPLPKFEPLFKVVLELIKMSGPDEKSEPGKKSGPGRVIRTICANFQAPLLMGAIPGALIFVLSVMLFSLSGIVLGVVLAVIGAVAWTTIHVFKLVKNDLAQHDFGMCTGLTQPGHSQPALTDWLTDTIDRVAGRSTSDTPLTIKDLIDANPKIKVATVTTDLTTRRPYSLPIDPNTYYFSKREFQKLFPARVVDHMTRHQSSRVMDKVTGKPIDDLWYFKDEEIPLVVLARMSLSFPFLFSAVPLYRHDHTLANKHKNKPVRCLFSDGGLSSNFPVHFFDEFLPNTPTFGISLTDFDERRLRDGQTADDHDARVHLPFKAGKGHDVPTHEFSSVGGFIWAMFSSAKDWQDTLQTKLPGYRERIVSIALARDEGGLNLAMPVETVDRLAKYGEIAGTTLVQKFCLDEHRWRRLLVETTAMEDALTNYAENYKKPAQSGSTDFDVLITSYKGKTCQHLQQNEIGYQKISKTARTALKKRVKKISTLGGELNDQQNKKPRPGFPTSRSNLRNIASMGYDPVKREP